MMIANMGSAYDANQVDVVLVFDTTGSMSGSINSMKVNAISFADALAASGIDYRLGLTEMKDFPSSCSGICGDPWDFAYKVYNGGDLVSSATIFNAWISSLSAGGGADWPESHLAALHHTLDDQHWRGGTVQKVIILISDAPPHADGHCCNVEGDTFAGTKNTLASNSVKVFIAGYDSGGDGVPNGWATDLATATGGKFYPLGDLTPILQDILSKIETIEITPQDPMTLKDVTLKGVVKASDDYEITGYLWTVEDVKTGVIEATGNTNPFTFKPAAGKYGDKKAEFKILYKNKVTGATGVDVKSKQFKVFFEKGTLNSPADDDGVNGPNWFEYWIKDGSVPDMSGTKYNGNGAGYGLSDGTNVYLHKAAAGVHYSNPITLTTSFGTETFGGPSVKGIDCAAEVVAHERYHNWVSDQWKTGGSFSGKTDSDKGLQATDCNDRLPDSYETDTSKTKNDDTDTYSLETVKHPDYRRYGDNEYMAMRTANSKKGDASKDWANPGKQTTTVYSPSFTAAKPMKVISKPSPAESSIVGNYADSAIDSNRNGLFDVLRITLDVGVENAGSYDLIGVLKDNSNQEIELVNNRFDLLAGTNTVELDFDGLKINRHGVNGPYSFSIALYDEEGNELDSHEGVHQTAAYDYTQFEGQQAKIAGGFSDTAEDSNGDAVFENLKIKLNLDVKKIGTYRVEGFLYGDGDHPISFSQTDASLTEGLKEVELVFSGSSIAFGEWKGAYRLRYLSLYDESGNRLGFELDPYQTKEYDAKDFKPTDAHFGDLSDAGQDANLDGFFEHLRISVGVDVLTPGDYLIEGVLSDSEGKEIEKTSTQKHLDAGEQSVPLLFSGKAIFLHGVSGVFKLTNLLLYDGSGTIEDSKKDAHTTSSYDYALFQPPVLLTGEYSDSGEDTNGNALFESLVVNVGVKVAKSGNVVIAARLLDSGGDEICQATSTAPVESGGPKEIQLKFSGPEIYNHGINGPYLVSDLHAYHAVDPALPDDAEDVYTTSAYDYQAFESSAENNPPAKPTDPDGPTEGFVDTKYDYAVQSKDPDGDRVKYTFDWGDGTSETDWADSDVSTTASHEWADTGVYQVKAKAMDSGGLESEWSNAISVNIANRPPDTPDKPIGVGLGFAWVQYSFDAAAIDPDGDKVKLVFDWGDGTTTQTDPVDSGARAGASHAWSKSGTFQVTVNAIDSKDAASEDSSALAITIRPNRPPNTPSKPSGSTKGDVFVFSSNSYSTSTSDPDKNKVKYTFDWGDGTSTATGLAVSGKRVSDDHIWTKPGKYQVKAFATDDKGANSEYSSILTVNVISNAPPGNPAIPSGPVSGKAKKSYRYTTSAMDPDGDKVKYTLDWGDGTSSTTGLVSSGAVAGASHKWKAAGTYQVKAMATDSKGGSSGYSDPLEVRIS